MTTIKNKINYKEIFKIIVIILGSLLISLNLNTFVYKGDLVPGGFSGLSILIQKILEVYFNIHFPFFILNITFNLIPGFIAMKYIGKKFTYLSFLCVFISSIFVDILPKYSVTGDILLICVFGGIIGGIATSLILNAGASGGGTDFIAMSISVKYGISVFNYMFLFSAIIIFIYGCLFGMDKALYSIIYQFCATQIINNLYKKFKKKTLFIITNDVELISLKLQELTNHSSTYWKGEGAYSKNEKYIIYTVLSDSDIRKISKFIQEKSPETFVNILNSNDVIGNFFIKPI